MGRTGITTAALAVRSAREKIGLSRAKLAKKMDCTPQTIEAWEYGYRALAGVLDEVAIKTGFPLFVEFGAKKRQTPGSAVKELRRKMKLTQEELALVLAVSGGMVNKMENGNFCPTLYKIEKALGTIYVSYCG